MDESHAIEPKGSTYRALDAEESSQRACSTVGCKEPPRWVHTSIGAWGIRFSVECDRCHTLFHR